MAQIHRFSCLTACLSLYLNIDKELQGITVTPVVKVDGETSASGN